MANLSAQGANGLGEHCRQIVRRFLLTAVIVDDELSVQADPQTHGRLTPPDPRASRPRPTQAEPQDLHPPSRPLRVDPITWSFARHGMVCGVVAPRTGKRGTEFLAKGVARADIVILDWRLSRETGETALPLLERILQSDQPDRLRLIAFYTGEPDQQDIRGKITDSLSTLAEPHAEAPTTDGAGRIDFGACRIVVYGKPGSGAGGLNTAVKEKELADRLIADLAEMAEGLLPSLVLTALAAVRENVYRVLKCFGPDLDPAFLAHRACLPQPSDSEQHMVEQIASELHGIMDEAISRERPAGIEAIDRWLADRFDDGQVAFHPQEQSCVWVPVGDVQAMLARGFENERPSGIGKRQWRILSHGLAGGAGNVGDLDRRLASTMNFRQVLEGDSRQLWMGTVVRRIGQDTPVLLCVTPRCDSVRLTDESAFLFLTLSETLEPTGNTPQVVVPVGPDQYRRMTVSVTPSEWLVKTFTPDAQRELVLARRDEPEGDYVFRESDGGDREDGRYVWLGELKPELAQSIAQTIATKMSRTPINKSEWLRRHERD